MVRGPDAQAERFLTDLGEIRRRLDRAEQQITSGKKINRVSDAPDEISHLLAARSDLSAVEQTQANLGRIKTETDTAEATLAGAIEVLERIEVLGTQGASDLTPPAARNTLAQEIEQLLGRLVNLSAVQLEGRFLFSGDTDQAPPYSFDLTQADPVSSYAGSAATREAQHPSGRRFPIARTARDIFDNAAPANNVFDSVDALRTALRANDSAAIRAALGNVRTATTHVNDQLAFFGGVQNQVTEAIDFASRQQARLRERISGIEDADLTAAILELNQSRFLEETALQAQASRPRTSLFNYLR